MLDGRTLPITVIRGLATDADAGVRERAFRAELTAWDSVAVTLAAALNAIKGEANTVNRRRGWADALEPALHANSVERPALEAMQEAAVDAFGDFRRFLLAKSRLLGHTGALPWWDLFAPVPGEPGVSWPEAAGAVETAFGSYSSQLAGLAHRALNERWVDAEPREGKRGGAFCMSVRADESRVLLNFDGSFDSVQTLAHELGHAYHNANLVGPHGDAAAHPDGVGGDGEHLLRDDHGPGRAGGGRRRRAVGPAQRGPARRLPGRRRHPQPVSLRAAGVPEEGKGTLQSAELCELMQAAQLDTYGDGLDPSTLHPYMWAVKPHYYSSAFYNWPYCFGLLFGTGLYARFQDDPDRFRAGYDDLLSSTGLASAAHLAARFDIDITSTDFWAASLSVIRDRIDAFERLVDSATRS